MGSLKRRTRWYNTNSPLEREHALEEGAKLLKKGGLVAFPTETVYGLGAHSFQPRALEKIFEVKGRPPDNPLIIHISRTEELEQVADQVPLEAYRLGEKFWPGPLTLVLKRKEGLPEQNSRGLPTIAVRLPAHPLARGLLKKVEAPLSAPSANLSGSPSPTQAEHVWEDLAGKIDAIIDGGISTVGVESTVLNLCVNPPVLLRPGGVTREQLEEYLGLEIILPDQSISHEPPSSPGMKYRHYSPRAPLYLVTGDFSLLPHTMEDQLKYWLDQGKTVGLLCSRENHLSHSGQALVELLGSREEPYQLAASLYAALRRLDARGAQVILAEGIAEKGMGLTFMNRLKKAAREIIEAR